MTRTATLLCAVLLSTVPAARAQEREDKAERAERLRDLVERSVVGAARSKRDRTLSAAAEDRPALEKIVRTLDARKISVNFEDTPLDEALDFIREVSGLNVVLSKKAREKLEGEKGAIKLKLKDVKLRSVLELLLQQAHDDLRYGVKHGVLMIGTDEDWKDEYVLRFTPVDDILHQPKDFPGPRVGLSDKGVEFDED